MIKRTEFGMEVESRVTYWRSTTQRQTGLQGYVSYAAGKLDSNSLLGGKRLRVRHAPRN